ncbi:MAG TPA: class I SAM-dependent methyltransferase [Candidatus Bathyarchaeia archaeon]|nr:class I SAM-dependent methyltransferase [Candidatus Bathyarchaeia archaeon]
MSKWNHKRTVMRDYNETAHLYDMRYAEEQEAKYKEAFEDLEVARHNVVLDVGCGTGLLFRHVAPKTEMVVGVDISRNLLLKAKTRAEQHPEVHAVQADADHLPFKTEVFSLIFAFTVLQNMPKPLETLQEIKRASKADAFIVVTGLKKVFSLISFADMLEEAGLLVFSFRDADLLKCYVAVAVKNLKKISCSG